MSRLHLCDAIFAGNPLQFAVENVRFIRQHWNGVRDGDAEAGASRELRNCRRPPECRARPTTGAPAIREGARPWSCGRCSLCVSGHQSLHSRCGKTGAGASSTKRSHGNRRFATRSSAPRRSTCRTGPPSAYRHKEAALYARGRRCDGYSSGHGRDARPAQNAGTEGSHA